MGGNTIILLFSCDFEVSFGNGCFAKWINFKVGAIYSPAALPSTYRYIYVMYNVLVLAAAEAMLC